MTAESQSYQQALDEHEWRVPERFNIAAEVCDSHPREKLAMIHEHFSGPCARSVGASFRTCPASSPTCSPGSASSAETGWPSLCRPLRRPRQCSSQRGSSGRCCSRCRCSTATRASRTGSATQNHECSSPTPRTRPGLPGGVQSCSCRSGHARRSLYRVQPVDTLAEDPAQLYYTSGTTGLAKGIVHAHRYILAHEEFRYCHDVRDGERFHGMGEWAWAAGIAPLLGPWR